MIFLDTHVLLWLHEEELSKFRKDTLQLMEENELYYSPIVKIELHYLYQKSISIRPEELLSSLKKSIGLRISPHSYLEVVDKAIELNWTRDPFDLLIVAECSLTNSPLITKDRLIRKHYEGAVW